VNTISPGYVATAATAATMDKEMHDFVMNMHLIRRPGTVGRHRLLRDLPSADESAWVRGRTSASTVV